MKKDPELIRKILLEIEKRHVGTVIRDLTIDGYDKTTVACHCELLRDEGYISYYKPTYESGEIIYFCIGRLTNTGCDYLDKIRDNSVRGRIKRALSDRLLSHIWEGAKIFLETFIGAIVKCK